MQSRNYLYEKGLADAYLSAQRGNMMTAIQNASIRLPNAIGGGMSRLYNNKPSYSGMGQSVDNHNAYATKTLNRLRNQKLYEQTQIQPNNVDYGMQTGGNFLTGQ